MRSRLLIAALAALTALAVPALAAPESPLQAGDSAKKKKAKKRVKPTRIASAKTADADGDGRVDRVVIRFSRRVKGSPAAGSFSVRGMRVTGARRPRGRSLTLTVAEGGECDLGAPPVVAYKPSKRKGLKDARGRRLRRTRVDMTRKDGLPPRLTCAMTADADRDGHIDSLELTYNKPVTSSAQASGPFAFDVDGYSVRSLSRADGRVVTVGVVEKDTGDTDVRPAITYSPSKGAGVRGRGGEAFPGTYRATRDGAAPALVRALTRDTDSDGSLDSVFATFSEAPRAENSALVVEGALLTAVARNGNDLTLAIAEGPFGTGDRPTLSYPKGAVEDASGNRAAAASVVAEDGAAPLLAGALTGDENGDGRIDTILVGFSEDVSHADDADGNYPLSVPGYPVTTVSDAGGRLIQLDVQQSSGPDTGAKPSVRYTRGATGPVTDAAGNEAVGSTFGGTLDEAAPRLVSATTADVDEDGKLDRVGLTWSEPVIHSQEPGPGAFTTSAVTPVQALAASGTGIDLLVQEAASANTGVRPLVGYSPDGTNDVRDAAGNVAPSASGMQSADGAGPVVVSAATGDNDSDHRLDRVNVTMSEPVSYPGDATAPFDLSAEGYTVTGVGAAAGSGFSVSLQEASGPDTGGAPAIAYGGGGLLEDANGVEAVERSYPGLTRDALPPSFVAAETADVDGNGLLDRVDLRYSESVQGGTSAAPFSASGRTVTGIEFSGDRARIMIQEAGSPDTDERPSAGYVVPASSAERVRDVPEGQGDTADEAPPQSTVLADDRARPAVVQAATADLAGPDGRVDRVGLTFSEPISHQAETQGPFSIQLSGHAIAGISAASGDSLTIDVIPAQLPDGGSRPSVTVSTPTAVTDGAGNGAYDGAFGGTTDGVRPVLAGAQLGETDGQGDCVAGPPQNGRVDCVIVSWSEPVTHADDPSLVFSSGLTPDGTVPGQSDMTQTVVDLVEGGSPDRDKSGHVAYTAGAPVPVLDSAGNEALSTSPHVFTTSACIDDLNEPNDSRMLDNPLAGEVFPAQLCSLDEDWYRLTPEGDDELHLSMNPPAGVEISYEIWSQSSSGPLAGGVATSNGSGDVVHMDLTGLTDSEYWLRVVGVSVGEEGPYCFDTRYEDGDEPCAGQGGDPI